MLKLAGFNSTIYSFNKKTGVSFTPIQHLFSQVLFNKMLPMCKVKLLRLMSRMLHTKPRFCNLWCLLDPALVVKEERRMLALKWTK